MDKDIHDLVPLQNKGVLRDCEVGFGSGVVRNDFE